MSGCGPVHLTPPHPPAYHQGMATTEITTPPETLASYDGRVFDPLAMLHTAEHAVAVYLDAEHYAFAAIRAGYDGATVLERGPAQAGLAWSPGLIVIALRGSDELVDWLGNLATVIRVRCKYLPATCGVGWGFRRQADRLTDPILERVRELKTRHPGAEIVITGHSLGAALVPQLVVRLDHHGVKCRVAVCHEAPRSGCVSYTSWYDEHYTYGNTPTWSIVNVSNGEHDLVTRIPKERWGFGNLGCRAILDGGKVLFGDAAWQEHRRRNPVGHTVAAWRILTRFYLGFSASVQAHFGRSLLASLRRIANQ